MTFVGSFGRPGVFGAWWAADPEEDLILIYKVSDADAKPERWAFKRSAFRSFSD